MPSKVDKVNQQGSASAEEIFESIHAITHLYRSRQYRELRDAPGELTHMEHKVLGFFARNPGATQSDLMQHSGRDKAQLTRLIRGLKEKGLLEARVDEGDRRSTLLQPSPEGRRIYKALQVHAARIANAAVAGMSKEECRHLASMLARLRANLEGGDSV